MSSSKTTCLVKFVASDMSTIREIEVPCGVTLLEAAVKAGIDLRATCGGTGRCGKCKVKPMGEVSGLTSIEGKYLSSNDLASGIRLACQTNTLGDVVVILPGESSFAGARILTDTIQISDFSISPIPPSVAPGRVQGGASYGVAIDIGTTTLVAYLMDLTSGKQLAVASRVNPQSKFGADVISRIAYAGSSPEATAELRSAVLGGVNAIIKEAAVKAGLETRKISSAVVVGNTCMHHLFLGIDPSPLGVAPFEPVVKSGLTMTQEESGLEIGHDGTVFLLPNIGGFVGADTVGVILASGLDIREGTAMAIDLGTNGEMVLRSKGKLLACSTAAGPAFEGWRISVGMPATAGAIDHVSFDHGVGDIHFSTIGGAKPLGICGSGMADLVAGFLTLGIITETGRMRTREEVIEVFGELPLFNRIRNGSSELEFVIATPQITFKQRDVRELQLASAAIHAGIETLKKMAGVDDSDIEAVYLAGGFGNYISKESARILGIVPQVSLDKIIPIGNGAGAGAIMALLSKEAAERALRIAEEVEHVDLGGQPGFSEAFMNAMVYASARQAPIPS